MEVFLFPYMKRMLVGRILKTFLLASAFATGSFADPSQEQEKNIARANSSQDSLLYYFDRGLEQGRKLFLKADTLLAEGKILSTIDSYQASADTLESILTHDDETNSLLYALSGRAYFQIAKLEIDYSLKSIYFQYAEERYRNALKCNPTNPGIQRNLSFVLYDYATFLGQIGETEKATSLKNEALALYSTYITKKRTQ